jgi:hypothetical protein
MSEKCQRESPYIAPLPVRDRYGLGPGGSLTFEMDAGPLAASRAVIVDYRDVSLPNIRFRVLVNNVVVALGPALAVEAAKVRLATRPVSSETGRELRGSTSSTPVLPAVRGPGGNS